MEINVLESLYKGVEIQAYYFVVEMRYKYNRNGSQESSLVLIALPDKVRAILESTTIDTITLKQAREIYYTYVDTNIYLYPKYPPFQTGQQVFRNAIYCDGLLDIDFRALLNNDFKSCYEVTKFNEAQS